jgi:hypothetical protein
MFLHLNDFTKPKQSVQHVESASHRSPFVDDDVNQSAVCSIHRMGANVLSVVTRTIELLKTLSVSAENTQ